MKINKKWDEIDKKWVDDFVKQRISLAEFVYLWWVYRFCSHFFPLFSHFFQINERCRANAGGVVKSMLSGFPTFNVYKSCIWENYI